MTRPNITALGLSAALILVHAPLAAQDGGRWKIHDLERPRPAIVSPGNGPGAAPGDAIVLFAGGDLREWESDKGGAPGWTVRDGYMETRPGAGALRTKRAFGDIQLHVEWASPQQVAGSGQGRGNSGVIIMERYEVQVLDSHDNTTYADGQAGAIYGQYPPLVNASRNPGEWQSYDIVFRRPRFAASGRLLSPARMTVFHNGVLIHDDAELWGETNWLHFMPYTKHADALPLLLQDHDNPVRYRNVWVRELTPRRGVSGPAESRAAVRLPQAALRRYAGRYATESEGADVILRGPSLFLKLDGSERELELVPAGEGRFAMRRTAGTVTFTRQAGEAMRMRMVVAEVDRTYTQR